MRIEKLEGINSRTGKPRMGVKAQACKRSAVYGAEECLLLGRVVLT